MSQASPTFAPVPGYSRSSIDRAGLVLRDFWEHRIVSQEVFHAVVTMITFRETFQLPLNKTVMGLRSMVGSEWPDLKSPDARVPVTQRLKREQQIMSKLHRIPETRLSNMGDIGGCRAVLDSRDRVDAVVKRIRKNWEIHGKIRDSRDVPAASGYRAVHLYVVRDGRRIEIQLRSPQEHEWAVAVERAGARLNLPLKEGGGPDELKEYFRLASLGMYVDSVGGVPEQDFLDEFNAAREAVRPLFTS